MRFYLLMDRLARPVSFGAKLLGICFVGVHIPMIGAVAWILLGTDLHIDSMWSVFAALLAATLFGTLATMACVYAMLSPVRAASRAIAGYLTDRKVPELPTVGRDEVGVLMLSIQDGITRLDAAIDAADGRTAEAIREKQEKFRLLSGLSHEFRTPLNHIIGFAETMSNEILGPLGRPTYREYATDIGVSGNRLLESIQIVMEMSQAEAGLTPLELAPVSVAEAVRGALPLAHFQAAQAGVQFEATVPETATTMADARALKQVLLHTLRAVIESAHPGSIIQVKGAALEQSTVLRIGYVGSQIELPATQQGIEFATPGSLHFALARSVLQLGGGDLQIGAPAAKGGQHIVVVLPGAPATTAATPAEKIAAVA